MPGPGAANGGRVAPPPGAGPPPVRLGRRTLALAVMVYAWAFFQNFVVPALPTLRIDLRASAAWTTWTVSAYILVGVALMPVLSRLGDQHGKRRVMLWCLTVFVLASFLAMGAQDMTMLVIARAIQGVALVTLPLGFAVVRDEYPPAKQGMALGLLTGGMGLGAGTGLVISGLVLDHLSWPWLFVVADVFALVSIALVRWAVPETRLAPPTPFDAWGAVLLAAGLLALLTAITVGPNAGWASVAVLVLFAVAAALLVAWAVVESRRRYPMVSLASLRLRPVMLTNLSALLAGFGLYTAYVILPELVQLPDVLPAPLRPDASYGLGMSATAVGLVMLPGMIGLAIAGPIAGVLMNRVGSVPVLVAGMLALAAGGAWLALLHATALEVAVGFAFVGNGWALVIAAAPRIIGESVPADETGIANGLNSTMRLTGTLLGGQIAVAVLMGTAVMAGVPSDRGFTIAFWLTAVASVLAAAMALGIRTRPRAPAPAAP